MPVHNTQLSENALSSITDLLSPAKSDWGTPCNRKSKSHAEGIRWRNMTQTVVARPSTTAMLITLTRRDRWKEPESFKHTKSSERLPTRVRNAV
jgi:hypothetical protein